MRSLVLVVVVGAAGTSVANPTPPMEPDIPPAFNQPRPNANFERRELMIPMRDGIKLKTFVVVPIGASRLPIVLVRTPYNASKRSQQTASPLMEATIGGATDVLADGSYILAYQDIRGKHGSEGDYVMTRPLRGPLNATTIDHATDTFDTIDWLVKNIKETNGKVGMVGSSYEGFTVLMGLVKPHPALKAAVPMCPMVDGWRGDDWFHNGAFRQVNFSYFTGQTTARGDGKELATGYFDDYEALRRGSAGDFAKLHGIDQLPYFKKLTEHASYDSYWQQQALDRLLAAEPVIVPTMIVSALWDQEDIYGGIAVYRAIEPKDRTNDRVFLVLGPWSHSGMNYDGRTLGPLDFGVDTAREFRRDIMKPFFDARLKDRAPPYTPPSLQIYETGTNTWRRMANWPATTGRKFYFGSGFTSPSPTTPEFVEFVSDPAKPVPYVARPLQFRDRERWRSWLLADQRFIADRPDVMVYQSEPLTAEVKLTGAPIANVFASTTGSDADWVVKLIDVYPEEVAVTPQLGGYQLPIAMEIFRGRYRGGLDKPTAITANTVQRYQFALPTVNHVFKPGHRIMLQIQSSWFPLYDRNPQTFVPNIFFAEPADYRRATHRIYQRGSQATYVDLPVASQK